MASLCDIDCKTFRCLGRPQRPQPSSEDVEAGDMPSPDKSLTAHVVTLNRQRDARRLLSVKAFLEPVRRERYARVAFQSTGISCIPYPCCRSGCVGVQRRWLLSKVHFPSMPALFPLETVRGVRCAFPTALSAAPVPLICL